MNLHVVHVIDRLGVGGAEFLVVAAAREAAARGWELTVVSLGDAPQSPVPGLLAGLGVRIEQLPSGKSRTLTDTKRLRRLRRTIVELQPDVVHTHLTYANTLTPLALLGTGIPVVATLHNVSGGQRSGQAARDRLEAVSLRRLAAARIAVGPSVRTAQSIRLRRRISMVSNPVAVAPDLDQAVVASARSELIAGSGSGAGPLLLAVGRLTEQKGFADLLNAFAAISEALPDAVLAIAGRGHLKDSLQAQAVELGIADRVRLLGPRNDVPVLLNAADLVVSSSRWEGMPLTLLEAMAAGRAIVATEVGDVRFAVGDAARLVPAEQPSALAAAVLQVLRDDQARAALERAAVTEAAERHSVASWSAALDGIYRALATPAVRSVAVLTHGYYPRIGGIERQRSQVTPRLVRSGLQATVITRAARGAPRRELREGVSIVRTLSIGGKAPGSAAMRKLIWKLAKPADGVFYSLGALVAVLRRRPDVIHTHEFISTARVGLVAGRILRRPVIVTSHRSGPLGDVGRHAGSARGERMLDQIRKHAALAIGVSDEIDGELAALGLPPERRLVVHNGVDTERFRPADTTEKQALRAALKLPAGAPIVVFTGRLMPEKRVHLLLDVWPEVSAVDPLAHLVVVGTGDQEGPLRASAPAEVTFVGAVEDTAPYLRAADVFVLPSSAEGLSNALLEAQASGLATVISDVGAARAVVTHGENGLIVPVDDRDALLAALRSVVADPAYRHDLGEQARKNVETNFSIDATVAAFVAAYRKVRSQKGR